MRRTSKDCTPWLLLPGMLLTLSGVTLLAPRQAAQAAPQSVPHSPRPLSPMIDDDGDGDELLEHWGDAKYRREARLQLSGMAGGFALLIGLAYRKRMGRQAPTINRTAGETPAQRKAA